MGAPATYLLLPLVLVSVLFPAYSFWLRPPPLPASRASLFHEGAYQSTATTCLSAKRATGFSTNGDEEQSIEVDVTVDELEAFAAEVRGGVRKDGRGGGRRLGTSY